MPYQKSESIDAVLQRLARMYPAVASIGTLPNLSWHGRTPNFLRITKGRDTGDKLNVLIVGGLHAREWAPPDALVGFCVDLLAAYQRRVGVPVGGYTIPSRNIQAMFDTLNIYIVPVINPDGRNHSLRRSHRNSGRMWRKNRNRLPDGEIGVDINRNHDILWNFPLHYSLSAALASEFAGWTTATTSGNTYHGPSKESEPETLNIKWFLDNHDISVFFDVHSYGPMILYPWSIEQNQILDSTMNFSNKTWDLKRDGTLNNTGYREFIPSDQWAEHARLARVMAAAIVTATGNRYRVQPGSSLYYASGTSMDYAFSRNMERVRAFTIESGSGALSGFHPDFATEFPTVKFEVEAALFSALDDVVRGFVAGTPLGQTPPALPPAGAAPGGGAPSAPSPGGPSPGGTGAGGSGAATPPGPHFVAAAPGSYSIPYGSLSPASPATPSLLSSVTSGIPPVSISPSAFGMGVPSGSASPTSLPGPSPYTGPPMHIIRMQPLQVGEGARVHGMLLDQTLDFTQIDPAAFRILMSLVWSSGALAGAITAFIQQFRLLGPQELEFTIPLVHPSLGGIPAGGYVVQFTYYPAGWSVDGERELQVR